MAGIGDALSKFQTNYQDSSLGNINASDKDKLREAGVEFEAIFVKMMLDSMRKNENKKDRLIDGGMAEEIFEDMLYTEYSRKMAKVGNFGIAEAIVRQYERSTPSKTY